MKVYIFYLENLHILLRFYYFFQKNIIFYWILKLIFLFYFWRQVKIYTVLLKIFFYNRLLRILYGHVIYFALSIVPILKYVWFEKSQRWYIKKSKLYYTALWHHCLITLTPLSFVYSTCIIIYYYSNSYDK
jgi:hypothetical protein